MSGNTKASLNQGGQKGARMSRRVLQVKRVDLERKDLARKASSEAGAEILLQNQGMETQGEKVELRTPDCKCRQYTETGQQARVTKERSGVEDVRC